MRVNRFEQYFVSFTFFYHLSLRKLSITLDSLRFTFCHFVLLITNKENALAASASKRALFLSFFLNNKTYLLK